MQRTRRTLPAAAFGSIDDHIVRPQFRNAAAIGGNGAISAADVELLAALMERASNAAKQMRYFVLAAKRFSVNELISSARRAGFNQVDEHPQSNEVTFLWSAGEPDLIFTISVGDPSKALVVAESRADISGLILTAYSQEPTVSVEVNPFLESTELGRNAALFRELLLTFPDFDGMPAWTKYPQRDAPGPVAFVGLQGGFVSVVSTISQTWETISSRISDGWALVQDRWHRGR
jgi:hypothetical protein